MSKIQEAERDSNGRWLSQPPGSAPVITSETARELQKAGVVSRYERAITAAQVALADGKDPTEINVFGGWTTINKAMVRMVHEGGHAAVRAAEFLGKSAGFFEQRKGVSAASPGGGRVAADNPEDLQVILDMLAEHRRTLLAEEVSEDGNEA